MATTKAQRNQKRQLKASLKAKARSTKKRVLPTPQKNPLLKEIANWPESESNFWMSHGINYLVSDYDNGTWTPLFPEIYEGATPFPIEEAVQKVLSTFEGKTEDLNAKASLAWAIQDKAVMYVYYKEALERLIKSGTPEADAPHAAKQAPNSTVWAMFAFMKDRMAQIPG